MTHPLTPRRQMAIALDAGMILRAADITPDPWQARALQSVAPRLLFNCARQSGKSTVSAALALHQALYQPGSLVLIVSPSERQSRLLYRKVLDLWRATGHPVPAAVENKLSLELDNGSQVHALPGTETTVRGFSGVDLLLVDEASRVSDDLYFALRPMLAVSGGRLLAVSTPFGSRGWWWEAWTGGEGWERYEVPATKVPRLSAAFLAEERLALGEWWYQQEYECTFNEPQGSVFSRESIAAATDPTIVPLFPQGERYGAA